MQHHVRKTPLAAALAFLVFLVAPAMAQAHHIKATASCADGQNGPVVTYKVEFIQFGSSAKPTTKGSVSVDGTTSKSVPPATINWNSEPGTLTGSAPGTPGAQSTVVADFYWYVGGKKKTGKETVKTNKCPTPPPKHPAISLEKSGPATATAGSTVTYTFTATNTGDVALTNVVLTDNKCQGTLTPAGPLPGPYAPGASWNYTCTVTAPAGPAQVDNIAEVCGDYTPPNGPKETVCDEDTHTFTVPPPATPETPVTPAAPPSSTPNTVPPGGSGVLPETVVSGRAALRGPSGCVKTAFRARVRGRSISAVTFFVDGRRIKRITGSRAVYQLKVRPKRYGFGRHTIIARVEFTEASGTPSRRLPLTFRRCAQGTVAPRFTG
jgi:uncharacterized repeat protein (TIGR01451 family)